MFHQRKSLSFCTCFTWKRQVLIWQLPFVVFWDLWCWPLAQRHLKNKCRLGRVEEFGRSSTAQVAILFILFRCCCCCCWMFVWWSCPQPKWIVVFPFYAKVQKQSLHPAMEINVKQTYYTIVCHVPTCWLHQLKKKNMSCCLHFLHLLIILAKLFFQQTSPKTPNRREFGGMWCVAWAILDTLRWYALNAGWPSWGTMEKNQHMQQNPGDSSGFCVTCYNLEWLGMWEWYIFLMIVAYLFWT